MDAEGYFIDWNGGLRSTRDPGVDVACEVDPVSRYVAVMSPKGALMHEATLYRTLEDVAKAGIKATLVPGAVRWDKP
ncbi:hypothetical protein [Novosphingobium mangrovi (ex Huang et al. 2023)]|uniref:Uncharacterized protein n=1 Tax=Novosphingobium mangrovi (ex Huang et al. 2023) TaxID=2976432 RepID=A0ABT2I266_9SPHN|nr:hypothetical protein [Novosphingobium mangrovi (ex Huang et al. 2023)]MCT2398897.1 hypothetical protein [Novosphingobium mangrovi (ex Huang et al. 2023)]